MIKSYCELLTLLGVQSTNTTSYNPNAAVTYLQVFNTQMFLKINCNSPLPCSASDRFHSVLISLASSVFISVKSGLFYVLLYVSVGEISQ